MPKIYVVTLRWITSTQNPEMIDSIVGSHGDWLRWNGWTWFVSTNYNPTNLRVAIMSRLLPEDSLIIAELSQAGLEGWAPKWVWDWFHSRLGNNNAIPPPPPV